MLPTTLSMRTASGGFLCRADEIFKEFRSRFIGKSSPVHFFWGSFDLAVTRFSGRRAPPREGADPITQEAYSHEVISAGFWPGGGDIKGPAFYAYAAPEPAGFAEARVGPQRLSIIRRCRIPSDVRRGSQCLRRRKPSSGISAEHLRGRCQPGELESRGTGEGGLNASTSLRAPPVNCQCAVCPLSFVNLRVHCG